MDTVNRYTKVNKRLTNNSRDDQGLLKTRSPTESRHHSLAIRVVAQSQVSTLQTWIAPGINANVSIVEFSLQPLIFPRLKLL